MNSIENMLRLESLEQWHFWFVGRRLLINQLLHNTVNKKLSILDVGCGTGLMSQLLIEQGHQVMSVDICHERLQAYQNKATRLIQGDALNLPFNDDSFDLILALDFLEHVDDVKALAEINRVLKSNGHLLLTVPAFNWLWSKRDENAGHLRRYSRQELLQRLQEDNFQINKLKYYQCFFLPALILSRYWGRYSNAACHAEENPSSWVNAVLTKLIKLEVHLGRWIPWRFGSTLAVLAQKNDE